MTCNECPLEAGECQTRAHLRVIEDVIGVVVIDEFVMTYRRVKSGGYQRKRKTNDEFSLTHTFYPNPLDHGFVPKQLISGEAGEG